MTTLIETIKPTQAALPVAVNFDELSRKKTLGSSLELCAELAGYEFDKPLQLAMGVDKAQFSRWQNGIEGVCWPKFKKLMLLCGNHAPLLWMLQDCGFDPRSARQLESQTEQENRLLREENAALRRVLTAGPGMGA